MPWDNGKANPGWNATRCSPIAEDPDAVGEPCTAEESATSGVDSCEAGAMCWGVDDELNGYCNPLCGGSLEDLTCPDEYACSVSSSSVVAVCLETCSPLGDDCDQPELACFAINNEFGCIVPGRGQPGDACDFINDCDPQSACIGAPSPSCESDSCCAAWCDLDNGGSAACMALDPATDCVPWFTEGEAPDGLENVGVCFGE